jgi:2-methylcitrate dehydratase PrpD
MTESAADHPSRALAEFAAGLRFDDLPPHVVQRAEELCLDWFGSALAGKGARPVKALERFVEVMGPRQGDAEILVSRRRTSPSRTTCTTDPYFTRGRSCFRRSSPSRRRTEHPAGAC